jgi:hypothetical protein
MTTREGSRASRYGAKDAGSFGMAVSSALPTVELFRPCPPPAVGARGGHSNRMSEKCPSGGIGRRSSTRTPPVAATAPAAPRTGRRSSRRIGGRCDRDAPARRHRSIPSNRRESRRSGAGLHPDRLVVERPIEQVCVAGLFEQIPA